MMEFRRTFSTFLVFSFVLCADGTLLPFDNYRLTANVGGHVVFNCHLDFPFGVEIPYQLQWEKDGVHIFSWSSGELVQPRYADTYGGRIKHIKDGEFGLGRGSINLTSIRETDNGVYRCLVIFPNRSPNTRNNGTFYYLEVDGGNLIVTPPVNVSCLEGLPTKFDCSPKSLESVVKWYKDGEAVADLADLTHRSTIASNGSLIIDKTTMSDPGEYECRVVNAIGEMQSASAFLNVLYKAKVVYAPSEKFLPYGKPASLDCFFRANPPLTNLRWEKDGFLFDPYNVQGVFYSRNGSLLFNKVDESHEGLYSCTPYNDLGTEGPSPIIKVVVLRPPQFSYKPLPLYLTKLGGSVTMMCGAFDSNIGSPPTITWARKDGLPLPDNRYSLNGGNITLEDITEEDRGVYLCVASNDADEAKAETEVMIENVAPRAAYNVTANATRNSIHVRWVPGHMRQQVDYHVWYRSVDEPDWRTMKILSLGTNEATIHNLKPGVEYEIRILSQDYLGDGLFSKPIFVQTTESNNIEHSGAMPSYMASGPPLNVTARIIDEGVLLTWSPPQYGADLVRRYVVRWYKGSDNFLIGSQHTENTYFLVPDTEEDELYSFVVYTSGRGESQTASTRIYLTMPAYSRVRAIALSTGCVAILLAVVAGLLYFGRDRICGLRDRMRDK